MPHHTAEEIRHVWQIINECRELGDDASVWSEHMARGIMKLIDADVVGAGHIGGIRSGQFSSLGAVDVGWEAGYNRDGWINALQLFAENPTYHAGMVRGFTATAEGRTSLLRRRQYISDAEWYRSEAYETTTKLMGFDDELIGMYPIGTGPEDIQCLIIYRDKSKPRFTHRQRQTLQLLMDQIQPLVGGPLAGLREIRPTELPARMRQVLACVLEGNSDKAIAERLKISKHTVHQYLKQIYRYFNVDGRHELMARWLRRGWGAKCAWRDGEPPILETIGSA